MIINLEIKSSNYVGFISKKEISCDDNKFTIKYKAYVKQKHFQMNWKIYATVIIDGTYNCNQSEFTTIRETIKDRPFNNFNIVKGNMPFDAKPYYIYTGNKIKYKLKWYEHDSTIIQFDNKYNDFLDKNTLIYIGYINDNGGFRSRKPIRLIKKDDIWELNFNTVDTNRYVLLFTTGSKNHFIYKDNYNQIKEFRSQNNGEYLKNNYLVKEIVTDSFKKTDKSKPLTFHKGYMPIYARPYHVYNNGIKIPLDEKDIIDVGKSIFNLSKYRYVLSNMNIQHPIEYLGDGKYYIKPYYYELDTYYNILYIKIYSLIYKDSKGHLVYYDDFDNFKKQTSKKFIPDNQLKQIFCSSKKFYISDGELVNSTGYRLEIQYYRLGRYFNNRYNKYVYKFPLRKYHKISEKYLKNESIVSSVYLRHYKPYQSCQKYRIRINSKKYISNWIYIMIFNDKIYYLN